MDLIEKLLKPYGVKYEQLNSAERETLNERISALNKNQLTLESFRTAIGEMKDAVERELIETPEFDYIFIFKVPNRKQILLKARLNNYLIIEAVLTSPEKAKQALERSLAGLNKKV